LQGSKAKQPTSKMFMRGFALILFLNSSKPVVVFSLKNLHFSVQGEFDLSKGNSAEWIFDAEIKNCELRCCLHAEKTKIVLCVCES
jgi:hypothetical protein